MEALRLSSSTCQLCSLFHDALEKKNADRFAPIEFRRHEKSRIWLISGVEAFSDLTLPKNLWNVRVNVGLGTLLKEVDLSIKAEPGRL